MGYNRRSHQVFMPAALRRWWNPLWWGELIVGWTFRNLEGFSWFVWLCLGGAMYIAHRAAKLDGVAIVLLFVFGFIAFAKLGKWAIPLVTIATIAVIALVHFQLLH